MDEETPRDFIANKATNFHVYPDQLAAYQTKFPSANVTFVGDLTREWISNTCTVTLQNGLMTVAPTNGVSGTMEETDAYHPWFEVGETVNSIVVENGVGNIAMNAFFGFANATTASIGKDVTSLGENAFRGCASLTSITIPAGVTQIGEIAFKGCSGLTDVYCYPNAAALTWNTESASSEFKPSKATRCHVNSNQLTAYQNKFPSANVTFVGDLDITPVVPAIGENSTSQEIEDFLADNDGAVLPELTIEREVFRKGYYNTICLPFAMSAAEIAASPLAGAEIKEFADASVDAEEVLHLSLNVVTSMAAGVPYFIRYSSGGTVEDLDFTNVHINKEPKYVEHNGVKFQGTFAGFNMPQQEENNHSYLFLGQNNQLFWPAVAGRIKPFRAFFIVETGGIHSPMRRGMPAVFDEEKVATSVELTQADKAQSTKLIENGVLYIIKNGVRYNAQGQIVK